VTQFDSTQANIPVDADPVITASKTVIVSMDNDMDGQAGPGDQLKYTIVITNSGDEGAQAVMFNDTPDPNTTLVPGSVMTSQGMVTGGNAGTPPVTVDVGDLAGGGGTVTIMFEVTVAAPLPMGTTQVCNQGTVSGNNFTAVLTDDPDDATSSSDQTCIDVNRPPVAMCRNVTVSADDNCQGNVQPSDVDNGSFDPDGGTVTLSLSPPGPYPLGMTTVTLTVTDEAGATDTCTAKVTVTDEAPMADAGEDQLVMPGDKVTLQGMVMDPDPGQPLTIMWVQTGGPMVTLTLANTLTPMFMAPPVPTGGCVVLTFKLKVTDPCGAMAMDTVTVSVEGAGANGLVMQDDGAGPRSCLRLFPCQGTYTWRKPDGALVMGTVTLTMNGPVLNFQSAANDANSLSGAVDLGRRIGNARLQVPRTRGGQVFTIFDSNIDNDGPCP